METQTIGQKLKGVRGKLTGIERKRRGIGGNPRDIGLRLNCVGTLRRYPSKKSRSIVIASAGDAFQELPGRRVHTFCPTILQIVSD